MRRKLVILAVSVLACSGHAWAVTTSEINAITPLAKSLSEAILKAESSTATASRTERRAAISQMLLEDVASSGTTPDELRLAVASLARACPAPLTQAGRWAGCPTSQEGMDALGSLVALADGNLQPSALSGRGAAAIAVPFEATTGGGSDYVR